MFLFYRSCIKLWVCGERLAEIRRRSRCSYTQIAFSEPEACIMMLAEQTQGYRMSYESTNQTSPIRLCWYEADHQLSLSSQAWFWVNGARARECVTSLMNSQSRALKLCFTSRERVSAIHYQRLKDWTIWRI